MKRISHFVGIVALALIVGLVAGCEKKEEAAAGAKPPATPEIAQKTCPVMAGPINKDLYVDHEGRRVYFCCAACVDTFRKEPEKYLAKVDAEIQKAKDAAKPNN